MVGMIDHSRDMSLVVQPNTTCPVHRIPGHGRRLSLAPYLAKRIHGSVLSLDSDQDCDAGGVVQFPAVETSATDVHRHSAGISAVTSGGFG